MFHRNMTGLDLHEPTNVMVENQSGATIPKLKAVVLDGFGTARPKVRQKSGPGDKTFGISSTESLNGALCTYVTVFGLMYNQDTSAWAENAILYADNTGALTTAISGIAVAVVIKSNATTGILFVVSLGSFIDPETSAWDLTGNAGTDEDVNFLGTTDAAALIIKTNNVLAAKFDDSGRMGLGPDIADVLAHFYQKSHLGYAGTGIRQETWAMTTNTLAPSMAYAVAIPDSTVCRVEFVAIGRSADGTARAMFKRTGLFYREGGNVQIQGPIWLSDQTVKSDTNLDCGYVMGVSTLTLNVKSSVGDPTFWTGHVIVEMLTTSA